MSRFHGDVSEAMSEWYYGPRPPYELDAPEREAHKNGYVTGYVRGFARASLGGKDAMKVNEIEINNPPDVASRVPKDVRAVEVRCWNCNGLTVLANPVLEAIYSAEGLLYACARCKAEGLVRRTPEVRHHSSDVIEAREWSWPPSSRPTAPLHAPATKAAILGDMLSHDELRRVALELVEQAPLEGSRSADALRLMAEDLIRWHRKEPSSVVFSGTGQEIEHVVQYYLNAANTVGDRESEEVGP